jgi:hypothetical protein
VSVYKKRQANFANYFLMDGDPVYCNICGLMEELQLQHAPDHCKLFINYSKLSLKAVLLNNGNKLPSVPLAPAVHMRETYARIQGLLGDYVMRTTTGTYVQT